MIFAGKLNEILQCSNLGDAIPMVFSFRKPLLIFHKGRREHVESPVSPPSYLLNVQISDVKLTNNKI